MPGYYHTALSDINLSIAVKTKTNAVRPLCFLDLMHTFFAVSLTPKGMLSSDVQARDQRLGHRRARGLVPL